MHIFIKVFGLSLVVVLIAVTGHRAIVWGDQKIEEQKERIACDWLSDKLDEIGDTPNYIKGLETACWTPFEVVKESKKSATFAKKNR